MITRAWSQHEEERKSKPASRVENTYTYEVRAVATAITCRANPVSTPQVMSVLHCSRLLTFWVQVRDYMRPGAFCVTNGIATTAFMIS